MTIIKNKTQALKALITISIISLTAACSSPSPTHLTVSPKLNIQASTNLYQNTAQLEVTDMRIAKYIVSILKEDEAAVVISADDGLDSITKKALSESWNNQGLEINSTSTNKIKVSIDTADVTVKQSTMSYVSENEIMITVTIERDNKVLTSKFKNKGNSDGALSVDIAVLERDFSYNFASVLEQIIQSKDIQKFLAP